jgi:uncharacterized protein (TIGR00255 family)
MPVYSMTGYAAVQFSQAQTSPEGSTSADTHARLGVEIRSVNSRFLDLAFRLPDDLRQAEPALRSLLTGKLKRGKVEMRVSLESNTGGSLRTPPPATLQRLGSLEDSVKAWLPQAQSLSVADILRLASGEDKNTHDFSAELLKLSQQALTQLLTARESEGARLAKTMLGRSAQLRELAAAATPLVPKLVEQQKARFLERWREAMALSEGSTLPEVAQDRALTEATAFAIRIDVAEEITRLFSHLDEIDRLLAGGGEVGKRLDFLIQELHREANTLGSKSGSLELTHISVDMKVLIEQIREQVQNIE